MTIKDQIQRIAAGTPEGIAILQNIVIGMNDIESQYHSCVAFQKVVEIKFDINKLKSNGYTLQEVLELGAGVLYDETERFVLIKLMEYIAKQKKNP